LQEFIEDYYKSRDTPLAKSGLKALSNSSAGECCEWENDKEILKSIADLLDCTGIFFIPFKTGSSLESSFIGQSVPNRDKVTIMIYILKRNFHLPVLRDAFFSLIFFLLLLLLLILFSVLIYGALQVKEEKGVKIYFDVNETNMRVELTRLLTPMLFSDPQGIWNHYKPCALDQLLWHVAAHEVGHAIYNLNVMNGLFKEPIISSLLEEPRAELTAMFTLRLMCEKQFLSQAELSKALVHFALDGMRFFNKFHIHGLKSYIIFHMFAFRVYRKHGFLIQNPETRLLQFDDSKILNVLDEFANDFEQLLDKMDARDEAGLKQILNEISFEDDFIREIVNRLAPGS
jgi:hypothetical protein